MTGQTAFGVAGQVGARRDPANRVDEHVSGRDQLTVLRLHARIRFVESDGERHGTGHVLRARAQAAFLPASGQHRFDGCAAAYQQRSQTFGGAEFVSGYGQGVHIPVTKTNRNLPGGLYGVYMDGHAVRVGDADQFLHGFHGADLVVGQHGGDHRGTFTGLAVELAFKCVEIEMCLRIHGNAHDFETEPFVQPCRRLGHGRVLDSGNDNARATICRLFAIGFGESADRPQAQFAHARHGDAFDGQFVRFGAA